MSYDELLLILSPYFFSYNHPIVPSITDYPVYIYTHQQNPHTVAYSPSRKKDENGRGNI